MEINPFQPHEPQQAVDEGQHEIVHEEVAQEEEHRNFQEAAHNQDQYMENQNEEGQAEEQQDANSNGDEGDRQVEQVHYDQEEQQINADELLQEDEEQNEENEEGRGVEEDHDEHQQDEHDKPASDPVEEQDQNVAVEDKVTQQGEEERYEQHEEVFPVEEGQEHHLQQPQSATDSNIREPLNSNINEEPTHSSRRKSDEEEEIQVVHHVNDHNQDDTNEEHPPNVQVEDPQPYHQDVEEVEAVHAPPSPPPEPHQSNVEYSVEYYPPPPPPLPTDQPIFQKMAPPEQVLFRPTTVVHTASVLQRDEIKEVRLSSETNRNTREYQHHFIVEKSEPNNSNEDVLPMTSVMRPAVQEAATKPEVLVPTTIVTSPPVFAPEPIIAPELIVAPEAIAAPEPIVAPEPLVAAVVEPPQPQQEFQILIPAPLFLTSNELHQMISSAYYERKEINIRYFTRFVHNRNHYYLKHTTVLDDITECILFRMKRTVEYLHEVIAHFEQTTHAYRSFSQESAKITQFAYLGRASDLKTKNRFQWSTHVSEGMKKLVLNQNGLVSRMRAEEYYLTTTCLQGLAKIAKKHEEAYRKNGKWAMEFKQKFCDFEEKIIDEIKQIQGKVVRENKQRRKGEQPTKYDLLELELRLLENIQKSRVLLEDWGKAQVEWWSRSLQQEIATVENLKELFKGYLHSMRDLHILGSPVQACLEYWEDSNTQRNIERQWQPKQLLSVLSYDFIRHSLELLDNLRVNEMTLRDVGQWSELRNLSKATGQREVLMDSLMIKSFECEINTGNSWAPGLLVSTIDENIILLTEFFDRKHHRQLANPELNEDAVPRIGSHHYHVVRKASIKNLYNTRKDEYVVSINEKVKGLIFDSWAKELARFKTTDSAEEFMYFTENKLEIKKQYVV